MSNDSTRREILIMPSETHTKINIVYESAARIMQGGILSSKLSAISIFLDTLYCDFQNTGGDDH
ncbi:uncharacterized protein EAE97_000929 [Botrytis byssoidea]|uniref:Uncharacterized protein n=1 Tax=Botrytis byssoidea TaxID=139641 RepID=A0A9P5M885_9HELO|nr:uncharacterized protein EAE97_000929 [Botrytis byssoidea]KAF7953530.1 hypothetical protein EAE97_000929 [Botrytis byssoidea]